MTAAADIKRLIDVQHSGQIYELPPPPGGFPTGHTESRVAFSICGKFKAVGDRERNQVHFWSREGSYIQSIAIDAPMFHDIKFEFSRDGLFAICGGSQTIVFPIHPSSLVQLYASAGPIATSSDRSAREVRALLRFVFLLAD